MLTAHEIFGFMSQKLARQILESIHDSDRDLYRGTLNAVADSKKLRPVFLERKPRVERDRDIIAALTRPRMEAVSASLIRGWLVKERRGMLTDFLDHLGIAHTDGTVDDLPAEMDDAKLRAAVDGLLGRFPPEEVSVYLNAFYSMNGVPWTNLKSLLETDTRLQLAGG